MAKTRRQAPVMLAQLTARIIGPVAAKRGFATADLISAWPEIIGHRFAGCTRPERIAWPPHDPDAPGVLTVKVEGPVAVLLQHELEQLVERVNIFMGYRAVGRIRLIQGPASADPAAIGTAVSTLSETAEGQLDGALAQVDDSNLKAALERLGRGVLSDSD